MADRSEFVDYLLDLLKTFGGVSARRMFGGYGIFRDGLMFALVDDEQLFFKVDDVHRQDFESLDLPPFEYNKQGKMMKLSYYLAPEEALDNPDNMKIWAEKGFSAALRAQKKSRKVKAKK